MDLKKYIREIPNYPKEGITFFDLTTLWKDSEMFKKHVDILADRYKGSKNIDKIVGIESRGFILGSVIAYILGIGFILVRKPGKLPSDVLRQEYTLEYGKNALEIHKDSINKKERVLIVDDLVATGGTICGAINLIEILGGEVEEVAAFVELTFLKGREKIKKPLFSLVQY